MLKINESKNKIPSITNVATTTAFDGKISEFKNKIPNITNLATTTALLVVQNKLPNTSNLVKKADYNTKISETETEINADHDHDKCITTNISIPNTREFYCKTKTSKFSNQT